MPHWRCGAIGLAIVFGDLMLAAALAHRAGRHLPQAAGRRARKGTSARLPARRRGDLLVGPWRGGLGGRSSVLDRCRRSKAIRSSAATGHPHAKPVDVMETLIAACPPGVIADPFAGSGSTLVAASNQGRRPSGSR